MRECMQKEGCLYLVPCVEGCCCNVVARINEANLSDNACMSRACMQVLLLIHVIMNHVAARIQEDGHARRGCMREPTTLSTLVHIRMRVFTICVCIRASDPHTHTHTHTHVVEHAYLLVFTVGRVL